MQLVGNRSCGRGYIKIFIVRDGQHIFFDGLIGNWSFGSGEIWIILGWVRQHKNGNGIGW
jgi:hypothetical protein